MMALEASHRAAFSSWVSILQVTEISFKLASIRKCTTSRCMELQGESTIESACPSTGASCWSSHIANKMEASRDRMVAAVLAVAVAAPAQAAEKGL
jgi:hypothetical protein